MRPAESEGLQKRAGSRRPALGRLAQYPFVDLLPTQSGAFRFGGEDALLLYAASAGTDGLLLGFAARLCRARAAGRNFFGFDLERAFESRGIVFRLSDAAAEPPVFHRAVGLDDADTLRWYGAGRYGEVMAQVLAVSCGETPLHGDDAPTQTDGLLFVVGTAGIAPAALDRTLLIAALL